MFNCVASSSKSLTCMWSHPQTDEYVVDHYRIRHRLADGFNYYPGYGTELGSIDLSPDSIQYMITNLLPYGGYLVELSAVLIPLEELGSGDQQLIMSQDEVIAASSTISITDAEGKAFIVVRVMM